MTGYEKNQNIFLRGVVEKKNLVKIPERSKQSNYV